MSDRTSPLPLPLSTVPSLVPSSAPMSPSKLAALRAPSPVSAMPLITVPPTPAPSPMISKPAVISTPAGMPWSLKEKMCEKSMWMFLIIAVIVLIILFVIAKPAQEWFQDLNSDWSWFKGSNTTVMAVLMSVAVLLMAFVSSVAYSKAILDSTRHTILALFAISMILLIVWFAVFYRQQNLPVAFGLAIAAGVVGLIQTWTIWKVDSRSGWGMIPYLLWLGVGIAVNWHVHSQNRVEDL